MKKTPHNGLPGRRRFFRLLTWGVLFLFVWLLGRTTRRARHLQRHKRIVLPEELPEGVSFLEEVIVVRHGDRLTLLEARCTHLGCTIDRHEGNILQCPCHGSQFDEEGRVVKGPATRPLNHLSWHREKESGRIVVDG